MQFPESTLGHQAPNSPVTPASGNSVPSSDTVLTCINPHRYTSVHVNKNIKTSRKLCFRGAQSVSFHFLFGDRVFISGICWP